ncbi:monocarboxylate transporter 14-like [Littorina saxatilis]|uniref:monocarboxylate transporter 14-like n=1 Tax=Littorina saxatilis TaxID=31220 RepID=UPI0038B47CFF
MEGGLWGLIIVASAFLIQVFAFGLSASIGVYNIEFLDYFDHDTVGVSFIAATNWATFLGSGPLVSFLMQKISYRKLALMGSALVALGVGLMPFLPYIPAYCLCFGLLAGFGSCLVYVPSHVLCGLYYDRHQSLATGIATSGSGLGGAIMPIVFGKLIETYGWKNSLVIVAGLELHLFVFAALLLPPPASEKRKVVEFEVSVSQEKSDKNSTAADPYPSIVAIQKNGHIRARLAEPEEVGDLQIDSESSREDEAKELLPVQEKESSSVKDEKRSDSVQTTARSEKPVFPVNRVKHDSCELKNGVPGNSGAKEMDSLSLKAHVKVLRHIYLFTDVSFNVYFFSSILWNASAAIMMSFGPEFVVIGGISQMNAAWLLTIFGLGDFIGGLIGGVIGNIWMAHRQAQYIGANVVFGVCILVFPFGSTFEEFAAMLICGGLAFGVVLGLLVVVLIDIVGIGSLVDGLGYIMLANGLGAFAGPALAGCIYKSTGAYDLAFYVGGLMAIVSGASMWLIPPIKRFTHRKNSPATVTIDVA